MAQRKGPKGETIVENIPHRNDDRNELLSISMYNIFKYILFVFSIHRDRNHKIVAAIPFCAYTTVLREKYR